MYLSFARGTGAAEREGIMERKYTEGQVVVYVDEYGKAHNALVTIWWGLDHLGEPGLTVPCCNVVYVSGDPKKDDTYGRQIERATSVVHRSSQPAHGSYYRWPDEE